MIAKPSKWVGMVRHGQVRFAPMRRGQVWRVLVWKGTQHQGKNNVKSIPKKSKRIA